MKIEKMGLQLFNRYEELEALKRLDKKLKIER